MNYRQIHDKVYKTSDPNLFIIAIRPWAKTLEEVNIEFATKENQSDPTRRRICHLANIHITNHQLYLPLYFENDIPKLKNLQAPEGFYWCVAEKNPFIEPSKRKNVIKINTPPHKEYIRLLKYSLKNLNNFFVEMLFRESIQTHVLKETSHFTDLQKSQRFNLIYNTHLNVLFPKNYEDKIKPNQYLAFIENMYERNIYEFMFNEYLPRTK